MIPKHVYKISGRVTLEMLQAYHTEHEVKKFLDFMIGQTMDEFGFYSWDYERWLSEGKRSKQLGTTWD